jgi:hypothetical protein
MPLALVALAAAGLAAWFLLDTDPESDVVAGAEEAPAELQAPEGDSGAAEAKRTVARFPGPGHGFVVVRKGAQVEILDSPGGKRVARVDRKTEFGSITVLASVDRDGPWVGVLSPKLGNGEIGWIRYDPNTARLGSTRLSIRVDLSQREVLVLRGDDRVSDYTVSVGRLGSGTPTGRFAVTDLIRGDLGVYGCCAIALTAHQPNLPPGWIGGDRIAIHGWAGPVGEAASGGCLRATNENAREILDTVPLGAPVFIRA